MVGSMLSNASVGHVDDDAFGPRCQPSASTGYAVFAEWHRYRKEERVSKKRPIEGINPTKPFYWAVDIGNVDGSRDEIANEGHEGEWPTLEDAIAALTDANSGYTMDSYVYHCVPVAKVWHGKIRVTKLGGDA